MDGTRRQDVTHHLQSLGAGDEAAENLLLPIVYDELRGLAGGIGAHAAPHGAGARRLPAVGRGGAGLRESPALLPGCGDGHAAVARGLRRRRRSARRERLSSTWPWPARARS